MPPTKPCDLAVLTLFAFAFSGLAEEPFRVWRSSEGQVIVASLLYSDQESATLKLADGRETVVALKRLSEEDREYLKDFAAAPRPAAVREMPSASAIDPNVAVEGGPTTFATAHFLFESEDPLTQTFVSEAARVFEGTLAAVEALPLGIVPRPAEGEARFRTRFMGRDTFEKEYHERQREGIGLNRPVQKVGGVYVHRNKEVLVPFTSLGMTASASYINLRGNNDLSTLIHEITHQMMHDWLPMMPVWVGEGIAEYVSAVPYQNGRFDFQYAADGLRKTLRDVYEVSDGQTVSMPAPSITIEQGSSSWKGTQEDYLNALMLVYFFIHLDQPDHPCATLANYLHTLNESRQTTEKTIADYNGAVRDFEEKRNAYNQEVADFNAALTAYQEAVAAYNQRIKQYNDQARAGVPRQQRIQLGEKPVAPTPPELLEVPDILKKQPNEGMTINLTASMQKDAKPRLYRERNAATLDETVRQAYQAMGIPVSFR